MGTSGPSVATQNVAMHVRNDRVCVRDVVAKLGDDSLGIHNTMVDVGNSHMGIYCKFGLEVNGQ